MVIYDHLDPDFQVKIYDRGVEMPSREEQYEFLVQYRVGDVHAPKVDQTEALGVECEHFLACCRTGERPVTDGESGLRVTRLLEAAEASIRRGGEAVTLPV
jgi:predicted dehydrogenase